MKVKTLALLLPLFASSAFAATLQYGRLQSTGQGYFPGLFNAGFRTERSNIV